MPKASTQLVGQSPAFRKALEEARVAAAQFAPVLIYGETGSGKGVFAEYIHRKSGRPGRLVSLNCASFQSNLFESELFGYMKGAFTGAVKDTPGLFEAAQGGTLFLDEIGDTPAEIQPKLLRALEDGVVRRVGGTREIEVDVRLVLATNRDLGELISASRFREDLYYRINSFVVTVPPLRERREDLRELVRFFIEESGGSPDHSLAVEAIEAMEQYPWPGNVRELRSAMAYAVAQAGERRTILLADLPDTLQSTGAAADVESSAHLDTFQELYRTGAEDPRLWAEFLLALNNHLGSARFARGDMLACLRHTRGEEPTNNSLINEWTRHIKPVPLRLGLIHEEGKKLRINIDACNRVLHDGFEPVDDDVSEETEVATDSRQSPREHARHTNIAAARTTFVGRRREQAELRDLLAAGTPNVITITGPGGTGKTRLARELGRSLTGLLPGGAWFADLTESRNIEGVAYAVAHALGVPLTGNQSPELAIGAILQTREPTLLILDNFEQVAEVASPVISDWAGLAPQVRFLVTSRALLGVEGEREFELEPLPTPDDDESVEAIARAESTRLFVERARVHDVSFTLDDKSARAIAQVCKRLEGMPLAIELAAARTVIMRPEQIAERMNRKFELLRSSRRDLSPRQQSLQATIDWSYDLLNDAERWAFAQLSVFRGGFFLEAAERILDLSKFPDALSVMDVVQGLREKSLLRAGETPYETRFNMYQVIREYAAQKWQELADEDARDAVLQRLADYYQEYASHWDQRVHSSDALEALDRLDYARSNFQAVLEWAALKPIRDERRALYLDLCMHLYNLLRVRGPARRRVPALREALQFVDAAEPIKHARLLFLLSQCEREAGDPNEGDELARQAVKVAETAGDDNLLAAAKFNLAGIEYAQERPERAQLLHREVLEIFRRLGNRANESRVLSRMALVDAALGDYEAAIDHSQRSEQILREMGDLPGLAFALMTRANIYNRHGKHEEGLIAIKQAERISMELADRRMQLLCVANRALMTRQLRRFDEAEKLSHQTTALAREMGDRVTLAKNLMNAGIMYVELARFDEAEKVLTESERLLAQLDMPNLQAVCVENLAYIRGKRGDLETALSQFDLALSLLDAAFEDVAVGVRTAKAEILLDHELPEEAATLAEQAVSHWRAHGRPDHRDYFRALAALAMSRDDRAAAEEALSVAAKIHFTEHDRSPMARTAVETLKKISKS